MALPVATLALLSFSAPVIRHNSCRASLIAALALHCYSNVKQQAISIMTEIMYTADKYETLCHLMQIRHLYCICGLQLYLYTDLHT